MSIKLMSQIWDQDQPEGMKLLLLLAIADMASDEGVCWPSYETLAHKIRLSRRYTIKLMQELEGAGYVEKEHRSMRGKPSSQTSNCYKVIVVGAGGCPVDHPPSEPQFTTPSEQGNTPPVNPSSLKSSLNHVSMKSPTGITAPPGATPVNSGKEKNPPDPRNVHPAIQAFRSVVLRYPTKALYDEVIRLIGETPDLDRLKSCRVEWLARGYNANSIKWLDWYQGGFIPSNGAKPRPASVNPTYQRTPPDVVASIRKTIESAREKGGANDSPPVA